MALDATVGGANANSYVTRAEAATYFADRAGATDWVAEADLELLDKCLITATQRLEQETWHGERSTNVQRLAWPRTYVANPDLPLNGSVVYLDGTVLPRKLKEATYELALVMYRTAGDWFKDNPLANFSMLSVGGVLLQPRSHILSGDLPAMVSRLLGGLTRGITGSTRLVRA